MTESRESLIIILSMIAEAAVAIQSHGVHKENVQYGARKQIS